MLYDILDHVVIDQAFLVLEGIHKSLFADPVDHTWNSGRRFMDLVQCLGCKYFPGTSGVFHMACDILFRFGPVQMGQDTVHIDTLANSRISLQFQLVVPEFSLTDQHDSHRTHGIKSVVEQKTEFFQCFLFNQMCFIKDTDDFLMLYSTDDLDLLLKLTLGITAVETGFQSQLIQHALIKPPWCQFGVRQIEDDIILFWKFRAKPADQR